MALCRQLGARRFDDCLDPLDGLVGVVRPSGAVNESIEICRTVSPRMEASGAHR
jgi:hypothetical protein